MERIVAKGSNTDATNVTGLTRLGTLNGNISTEERMNVPNVTMLCTSRQTTPKGTGRTHRMNKLEEKEKGTGVTDMSTVMTYEEKRAAAIARGAQQAYQAVNPTWLPLDE